VKGDSGAPIIGLVSNVCLGIYPVVNVGLSLGLGLAYVQIVRK